MFPNHLYIVDVPLINKNEITILHQDDLIRKELIFSTITSFNHILFFFKTGDIVATSKHGKYVKVTID